jgi:K(+)-stimulated pyrophosphate-energized sodium pump
MNLVSLLIAPSVVAYSVGDDANTALRLLVALVAAAIIVGAVLFSQRRGLDVATQAPERARV